MSKRPHPASLSEHMKRQKVDPNNRYLYRLYGLTNLNPSDQKIRALQLFKAGKQISEIADTIAVQHDTAAVYVVHALAAGASIDFPRLAEELDVTPELFAKWSSSITPSVGSLSAWKQANNDATYNQLRLVIALKIHGLTI